MKRPVEPGRIPDRRDASAIDPSKTVPRTDRPATAPGQPATQPTAQLPVRPGPMSENAQASKNQTDPRRPLQPGGERRSRPTGEKRSEPNSAQLARAEAHEARKRLKAAKRERKRFERSEVRRFTERSRRRRAVWLVALSAIAALVAFVLVGSFSPLMALKNIEVQGASRVSPEAVADSLAGQLGRPLTLVDHEEVEKSLSAFTLIRSYSTQNSPPNTLIVRIVERTPVALVSVAGRYELVDSAGVVIETSDKRSPGYALIKAPGKDSSDPGFQTAVEVLSALPQGLREQVDTVSAHTRDDVTLKLTKGGPLVVWGSAADTEFKAAVLSQLIDNTNPKKVKEYDVSSPNSAVVR